MSIRLFSTLILMANPMHSPVATKSVADGSIGLGGIVLPAMPAAGVDRARALERQASELQRAGRYLEAEKPLLDAIALWTQYRGANDIEVLNDTMNLAVAYRRHGDAERAVPLLERVSKGLATCSDPDAPELRRKALNNLAAAYRYSNRSKAASRTS